MREGSVIKAEGRYYRIRYRDPGILRPEDHFLYRADRVEWKDDHWSYIDDADYLIDDERRVVAKEVGWCLRREVIR